MRTWWMAAAVAGLLTFAPLSWADEAETESQPETKKIVVIDENGNEQEIEVPVNGCDSECAMELTEEQIKALEEAMEACGGCAGSVVIEGDAVSTFASEEEFQKWCEENGIDYESMLEEAMSEALEEGCVTVHAGTPVISIGMTGLNGEEIELSEEDRAMLEQLTRELLENEASAISVVGNEASAISVVGVDGVTIEQILAEIEAVECSEECGASGK